MINFSMIIKKTICYLHKNGLISTCKKIMRRVRGTNWLPAEEDHLFIQRPCEVLPHERWEMPKVCMPYNGKVSVVIPSFNGAHELPALLAALRAQAQIKDLEIVVVDSGSIDGTPELAEEFGAKVIRIKQEEFSHSYSRMLGATNASGEYLLFMTQDALPDREDWIIRMLQPCLVSNAAAVSCYETPKPDADLLSHITVWNWKNVMSGGTDRLTSLPVDCSYDNLRRNAQLSDNACLVNRSIFMELGGHRGAYAEDLDLGIRLLKAGYKLGILSSICVVHSHNRPAIYNFKRSIVDAVNIAEIFDDFQLDHLGVQQAMNRVFTAACANKLFIESLSAHPSHDCAPSAFAEWTRNEYNRIILQLKKMTPQVMKDLLFAEDQNMDSSIHSFINTLWTDYSADFRFDGGLAATQGRYIMHTVCPYLESIGENINQTIQPQLPQLIWQYFGQSAGYTVAAPYLNPAIKDSRIDKTVQEFSTGV